MQIYYSSLQTIQQQTKQLDNERCKHCGQTHQLMSHGFIRKKKHGGKSEVVGKRVFCSNRHHRTGCGRTMQLYLDSRIRYLRHLGSCVVALVFYLIEGMTMQCAYQLAIGDAATPRNGHRWLKRLCAQQSVYRSVFHQPPLDDAAPVVAENKPSRLLALMATFKALSQRFLQPLCCTYQSQLQRSFL